MSIEASPKPSIMQEKERATRFLSNAKDIIQKHSKMEPLRSLYGNDVFPAGTFETPQVEVIDKEGKTRRVHVIAVFEKANPASLSAKIVEASLKEANVAEPLVTVHQDRSEYQYIKPEEKNLPSLDKLQDAMHLMNNLHQKYAHRRPK